MNEVTIRSSIIVKNGSAPPSNYNASFLADQALKGGPSPGELIIDASGRDVFFTELTTAGWAWIQNMEDPTTSDVYVTFGIYDQTTRKFFALGELLPGEGIPFRFSRQMTNIYLGSGTGTLSAAGRANLRFEAHGTSTARVFVGAFNK